MLSDFHFRRSLGKERTVCKSCDRQYQRNWRAKYPEKTRELTRQWRKDNLAAFRLSQRAHENKRRSLKKGSGEAFTPDDVKLQRAAQTDKKGVFRCWWCGNPLGNEYHVDHRIPITKGGRNDAGNIVLAHRDCNMSKSDKMPWEFNGRLL
jgi:5-methylcytosine-specific restriction endonuclease McrA